MVKQRTCHLCSFAPVPGRIRCLTHILPGCVVCAQPIEMPSDMLLCPKHARLWEEKKFKCRFWDWVAVKRMKFLLDHIDCGTAGK